MSAEVEVQLIAVLTAAACALPGVLLVLRKMAMMTDAISHAILPGIVIGFFLFHEISSPWLVVTAAIAGVVTVWLVELVYNTGNLRKDAAIGFVFPVLFSVGVILITRYAGNVHLDIDAVLMGEIAFAPFDRLIVAGTDIGPKSLYVMGTILLINLAAILVFYKELKVASFDAAFTATLGLAPTLIHYAYMSMVSVTVVGAFNVVGSILVVALFIGPAATAYLLTDRLSIMFILSVAFGAISSILGYWLAHWFDVSIAGSIASTIGLVFLSVYIFAPDQGLVAKWRRRQQQRIKFYTQMLLVHLHHHERQPDRVEECRIKELDQHLTWDKSDLRSTVSYSVEKGFVKLHDGLLSLSDSGRKLARRAVEGRFVGF